jgi:broad specificity phosphatase PhoE
VTDLLLVRHGLSEWNVLGRWQGWADIPLAEAGEAQSREARPAVHALGITAVVHSGMRRTERTAEVLAEGLDIPIEVEPGLKEYDVGEWSGLTRPEIEARWPGALDAWFEGRLPATPGGESRDAFAGRLLDAVRRVALTHPGGTVLCVTHGGAVGSLQRVLSETGDQRGPRIANLSGRWVHVDWEGERFTLKLGDLVHLLPPAHETESPSA